MSSTPDGTTSDTANEENMRLAAEAVKMGGDDVIIDLTDSDAGNVTVSTRPHLSVVSDTPASVVTDTPVTHSISEPKVTIVVPTLNEAKNLPHVFGSIAKLESQAGQQRLHEIILVDGFSTDDTIEVARSLRPDIRVVHQTRRGKGNALKHGFEAATGDIIVMLDADGSADPAEIPAYINALMNGADFAKGTRFANGGGSSDITSLRRLGNWGLNTLTNVLYRTKFTDLCYGYNVFWKHCLPHMNVDCDGFEVETLINVRVAKAGLKIAEVGSFEADRIHGSSNLNTFRDGWRVLKTIFKERVRRTSKIQIDDIDVEEAAA